MARLGTGLLIVGLLAIAYGALWQLGIAPGSRVTLPAPAALQRAAPTAPEIALPTPVLTVAALATLPVATLAPLPHTPQPVLPTAAPTPVVVQVGPAARIALVPADSAERTLAKPRETGYAVRLVIPAIKLDTQVEQGGIVVDKQGNPAWQTLPFVAVHYGDLTSLIGASGNAVIAGHVVTLNEGNVFRFLYKLDIDDQIDVWDQHDRQHDFHVVDVKLVPPGDTSVMLQTPDETLTLITCGGTFDPVKREFSDRLIVIAKPMKSVDSR